MWILFYGRSNLGKPRLSNEERTVFITRILLPSLNSQDDDKSYDMRYALRDIVEKYEMEIQKESLSSSAYKKTSKKYKKKEHKDTRAGPFKFQNFKRFKGSTSRL